MFTLRREWVPATVKGISQVGRGPMYEMAGDDSKAQWGDEARVGEKIILWDTLSLPVFWCVIRDWFVFLSENNLPSA